MLIDRASTRRAGESNPTTLESPAESPPPVTPDSEPPAIELVESARAFSNCPTVVAPSSEGDEGPATLRAIHVSPGSLQRAFSDADSMQKRYEQLLNPDNDQHIGLAVPKLTKAVAQKLLERSRDMKLFLHSYSVSMNLCHSDFDVYDMMRLARREGLAGIKIHIDEGGAPHSLASMSDEELHRIGEFAAANNLTIHLETSSTSKQAVNEIVRVALQLGVKDLRVYSRPEGSMRLSQLKALVIADLSWVAGIAEKHQLRFVLEPHEVLKSHELVEIIKTVNSPRVTLLFDFGNMVNAYEHPLEALQTMAPYITQVHAKDVRAIAGADGLKQIGVKTGTGDLNQIKMLHDLLLLGEDAPQVESVGLEEEVGYVSPPFRFASEDKDPVIPVREKSSTRVPDDPQELAAALAAELKNAHNQITALRGNLRQLNSLAADALKTIA